MRKKEGGEDDGQLTWEHWLQVLPMWPLGKTELPPRESSIGDPNMCCMGGTSNNLAYYLAHNSIGILGLWI